MTLEELQAAANNGDIEAMISLGEQCLEGRTLNACKDALNWFDMAAQKDSAYAATKASAICALIAETYMSNGALGQETFGFWQKTILHALGAMKDPDDPDFEENSDLLWKLLDKGFLGVACLQYMNEQAAAALETLKRIDPPNTPELINAAKLLKVVCMVDAVGDSAISEIISVFNSVFSDKEYVNLISNTTVLEQLIFSCSANIYGVMLRKGIGTPANPQLADAVLNYTYNALSEDIAKKGLRLQS